MADRTATEFAQLLRTDFIGFIHRSFLELNPQATFLANWHIEVLAAKLEAVRRGDVRRLIISIPPRHLKSHSASVTFVAWLLGHNPTSSILCVSYAQDLAEKLARDCKRLMMSAFYRALFRTRISDDRQAVSDFETNAGGGRFSTSTGGVVTGRGGDFIIIDDPLKADDAYSEIRRTSVNEWYDNTLYSRLNNKEAGAIVLIMQRLHADDLAAHVQQQEPWEVLSFPSISSEPQFYEFPTAFGRRRIHRPTDSVLHAARETRERLEAIQRAMGEARYQAQYQQNPQPPGGIYVKPEWFKMFDSAPDDPDTIIQSWDTASKVEDRHDFSVCTTWAIRNQHAYLLNVFRQKLEFPDLKRAVVQQNQLFRPSTILIEDSVSGTALIQQLREDGLSHLSAVTVKGEKEMRFRAQTARIEGGFVHLPKDAPWRAGYILEVTSFPNARHDDQVDSTTHALKWLSDSQEIPHIGLLRYYEQEAANVTKPKMGRRVRIQLPPCRTYTFSISPFFIHVDEIGIIEVDEEVADLLRSAGAVRLD